MGEQGGINWDAVVTTATIAIAVWLLLGNVLGWLWRLVAPAVLFVWYFVTDPDAPAAAVADPDAPAVTGRTTRLGAGQLRIPPRDYADEDDEVDDGMPAGVPVVALSDLADADNILIVGPKGSGKTTLLNTLIGLRRGWHEALDPHNAPGKWGCQVYGGGLDFDTIHRRLQRVARTMRARYGQLNAGERTEADFQSDRVTIIGDEWMGISTALPDQRATREAEAVPGAGAILAQLLTQSRKVAICVLAASHNDTAAGVGMAGNMALLECFDAIIYLGGRAATHQAIPLAIRQAAAQMDRPAVVRDTERNAYALLLVDVALPAPRVVAPTTEADEEPDAPAPAPLAERLATYLVAYEAQHGKLPSRAQCERYLFGHKGGAAFEAVADAWEQALLLREAWRLEGSVAGE